MSPHPIPHLGTPIQVRPRYADGRPKQGWQARLIHRSEELLILRGPVQRSAELGYVTFAPDDVMTEHYWFERWYNIFALHDAHGGLKGWYANICTPITFDGQVIRYTDLDLDLWVWPDRGYRVLDEEDFQARVVSTMPESVVKKARGALEALLTDLQEGGPLFQEPIQGGKARS